MSISQVASGVYRLGFVPEQDRQYRVQFSPDLISWEDEGAPVEGESGRAVERVVVTAGWDAGFFRLVIQTHQESLGDFVLIPGGSFQMGDSVGDSDLANAHPFHTVHLSPYFIGRAEVTGLLWRRVWFWGINNGYPDLDDGVGGDYHPVSGVSWYDAVKWCNAASERDCLAPVYRLADGTVYRSGEEDVVTIDYRAGGYRLPSEAEWEKAARGGLEGKRFPWGDTISHSQANYFSWGLRPYDVSPTREENPFFYDGDSRSGPVGSFAPNGFDLYDVVGNVGEWCNDWWGAYDELSGDDPMGPASGDRRVIRGGDWRAFAQYVRVAYRVWAAPDYRTRSGLRLARSLVHGVPPLGRVLDLSADADDELRMNLSWRGPTGGVGAVVVRRGTLPGPGLTHGRAYAAGDPVGDGRVVYAGPANAFVDRGLEEGAVYHYTVFSYDHSGSFGARRSIAATARSGAIPYDFVLIPEGSFPMGDSFGEGDRGELPVHPVHASAFYMGRTEVTLAQWEDVREWSVGFRYLDLPEGEGKGAEHPVYSVSWHDAVKWCNAASERDGLTPVYRIPSGGVYRRGTIAGPIIDYAASGYRLPSEAEWEKAARGGLAGRRFPQGDTISHSEANYESDPSSAYDVSPTADHHPDYDDFPTPYTSPVGSFASNGYGLFDIEGNLSELCNDWYDRDYYEDSPNRDPSGPAVPYSPHNRVLRGGGWGSSPYRVRTAHRGDVHPASRSTFGFRLARSQVP